VETKNERPIAKRKGARIEKKEHQSKENEKTAQPGGEKKSAGQSRKGLTDQSEKNKPRTDQEASGQMRKEFGDGRVGCKTCDVKPENRKKDKGFPRI